MYYSPEGAWAIQPETLRSYVAAPPGFADTVAQQYDSFAREDLNWGGRDNYYTTATKPHSWEDINEGQYSQQQNQYTPQQQSLKQSFSQTSIPWGNLLRYSVQDAMED